MRWCWVVAAECTAGLLVALALIAMARSITLRVPDDVLARSGTASRLEQLKDRELPAEELRRALGQAPDIYLGGSPQSSEAGPSPLKSVCIVPNWKERLWPTQRNGRITARMDSIALGVEGLPSVVLGLLPEHMSFRIRASREPFTSIGGDTATLPTFEIIGSRRLFQPQFPSDKLDKENFEWVESWKGSSDYRRLFWLMSAVIPGSPMNESPQHERQARLARELPPAALTDTALSNKWGTHALWLEQNLPFATLYMGATEYRVHTYSLASDEGRATDYYVQLGIRPRSLRVRTQ